MIHRFSMNGTNIVVDVNSGSVHIFDDLSYDILEFYENKSSNEIVSCLSTKYKEADILEAISEIDQIKENGLLFSKDEYKEYMPLWDKKPVVKALCLHISHDCNLRCKYCFASTGDFGGERLMMSAEVGKKALDFLVKESAGRKNLEIDFFGGEPLMNFDVVKEIIDYGRSLEEKHNKKFKFTLTTNALLLNDEIIEYINENIQNIVLSLDGRKDVNDNMRFTINGKGSYENILPKIIKVAESRNQDNYYVRGTFTRENLDFSKDVIHLADLGFKQISVEPVVAAKDTGFDLREEDIPFLNSEYDKLAVEYVNRKKSRNGFNFFHFMIDLSQGPCIAKRLGGCGSGHEYLAITPEGDIYPCHQFVGSSEYKMGSIMNGDFQRTIQSTFKDANVYTKEECAKCWAKFYCSGGCAANSVQFYGDIKTPYKVGCELEKKRVECALWIKTQE